MIDPKLKKIFKGYSEETFSFLSQLSTEHQIELADIIQKRLDDVGGPMLSTMAMASNLVPNMLNVKIAQDMLGPELAAKITSYVSVKKAITLAKSMRVDFLAEVAIHLHPEKVVAIVEATSDELLIKITRILLENGQYDVLSAFSDHVSPYKLKVLAEKLGDIKAINQIGQGMQDRKRMIETAMTLSDAYLIELMQGISFFGYYELAAMVGQMMDVTRQIRLLDKLNPIEAARIAAHYPPEIISQIIERIPIEQAVEIGLQTEGKVLGQLFNSLPVNHINALLPYLNEQKLLDGVPYVNIKRLENIWHELSQTVKNILIKIGLELNIKDTL
ncbi:MAG: hypothetical protein HQK77_08760 [Desulfobacterales bacterium]|nr:hypothetical protein [Desulfobacterales bacterium]